MFCFSSGHLLNQIKTDKKPWTEIQDPWPTMVWFRGKMIINNSANLKLHNIYRPLVMNILTDYNFDLFTQVQTLI